MFVQLDTLVLNIREISSISTFDQYDDMELFNFEIEMKNNVEPYHIVTGDTKGKFEFLMSHLEVSKYVC